MSLLPDLERELTRAADRREARRLRPVLVASFRRVATPVAAALAVVGVAGVALAATGVWNPPLGDALRGHPSRAASPPPKEQLELLGVLRRKQTAADRSWQSRNALRFQGKNDVAGVRVDSVRLLGEHGGRGFVLISVERYDLHVPGGVPRGATPAQRKRIREMLRPKRDGLCVFAQDVDGGGGSCYSTQRLRDGRFGGASLGDRYYGLVPDGVATVRLRFADGARRDVAVRDNFYLAILPSPRVTYVSNPERRPGGGPTRRVTEHQPVWPVSREWLDGAGRSVGGPWR